jgi:membrane fusion protein (multidrug efflux system)
LKAGERVIIEGLQKAKPGAAVNPAPFEAATAAVTPAAEKAAASSNQ